MIPFASGYLLASLQPAIAMLKAYRLPRSLLGGPVYRFGWEAWKRGEPMSKTLRHRKAIHGWIDRAAHEASESGQ